MQAIAILACFAASVIAHAQYSSGGGAGGLGGNGSGLGNNARGGGVAAIARVAVGPNGFNPGLQGLNSSGGGLFGVTRRTYMGEANFIAAQYFRSAGVPVATNSASATGLGGTGFGGYAGNTASTLANRAGSTTSLAPGASSVDFVYEAPAASSTSSPLATVQSGGLQGNPIVPRTAALSGSAKPGIQGVAISANRNRAVSAGPRR
jgi:hypothetical protein